MTNQIPKDNHNTSGFSLFGGIRGGESNNQNIEQKDNKLLYGLLIIIVGALVAIYFNNQDIFKLIMQSIGGLF